VGGFQHGVPWLAIEEPWLAQAQKPLRSPRSGTISESVGSFQFAGELAGRTALTIESLLMSGCG